MENPKWNEWKDYFTSIKGINIFNFSNSTEEKELKFSQN
jgi:hypothetical protein